MRLITNKYIISLECVWNDSECIIHLTQQIRDHIILFGLSHYNSTLLLVSLFIYFVS